MTINTDMNTLYDSILSENLYELINKLKFEKPIDLVKISKKENLDSSINIQCIQDLLKKKTKDFKGFNNKSIIEFRGLKNSGLNFLLIQILIEFLFPEIWYPKITTLENKEIRGNTELNGLNLNIMYITVGLRKVLDLNLLRSCFQKYIKKILLSLGVSSSRDLNHKNIMYYIDEEEIQQLITYCMRNMLIKELNNLEEAISFLNKLEMTIDYQMIDVIIISGISHTYFTYKNSNNNLFFTLQQNLIKRIKQIQHKLNIFFILLNEPLINYPRFYYEKFEAFNTYALNNKLDCSLPEFIEFITDPNKDQELRYWKDFYMFHNNFPYKDHMSSFWVNSIDYIFFVSFNDDFTSKVKLFDYTFAHVPSLKYKWI